MQVVRKDRLLLNPQQELHRRWRESVRFSPSHVETNMHVVFCLVDSAVLLL
eukprot:COSAG05_NODE_20884_length_276_cov_0.581921_1_plen_50_part_10